MISHMQYQGLVHWSSNYCDIESSYMGRDSNTAICDTIISLLCTYRWYAFFLAVIFGHLANVPKGHMNKYNIDSM